MKPGPKPKTKHTWYVSFEFSEPTLGKRAQARTTETFRDERDAKAYARAKLAEGPSVNAGTLNPHLPKRTITSRQILDWLKEPPRG